MKLNVSCACNFIETKINLKSIQLGIESHFNLIYRIKLMHKLDLRYYSVMLLLLS